VTERTAHKTTVELLAHASQTAQAPADIAIEQAKLLLLDTICCGLAGRGEPASQAILAATESADSRCAIIGQTARTTMLDAVFLNGLLIRVLDFNDYIIGDRDGEPESAGHPSDNIPVALAVGSARGGSGRDILAAIVLGYELYARLQHAMDRAGPWDGVTASGLVAPAMAARLMGLSRSQLAHALALGAARAVTPSIVRGGHLSTAKSLANALVAQSGVQAAVLAESGATGPLAILDDERGLRHVFDGDLSSLAAPFPPEGAIMRAHVKAYPCINTGQSAVAAALTLHGMLKGDVSAISRIEVTMADYKVTKRHQDDRERNNPSSREAADHSFPFIIAAALLDGRFGPEQFANERWRDERIRMLMSRIVLNRDGGWNVRAPGSYPCTIRVTDALGKQYGVDVAYPPGYSRGALDANTVTEKFHALTDSVLAREERARIVDSVMELDRSASAERLDAAIAIQGRAR
jgi:2-methylcitrate dehydratase